MANLPDKREEFSVFFEKEYRPVVAAVMYAGASFEDAEDAVTEAMMLAASRFHELDVPAAWVRVVAIRRYIRAVQRDREREQKEQLAVTPVTAPRPEDSDQRREVLAILADLPPTQRLVLALSIDGFSCPEIASMINSSQDTVRSNLRHARRAMEAELRKEGWII